MKANSGWIKTDYWVQTFLGVCIIASAISIIGWFVALVLLIPLGAWQIISGIINAIKGERVQQIYLAVVVLHIGLWYLMIEYDVVNSRPIVPIFLLLFATVIGVWKYTVARADYISLKIIEVPNTEDDSLLDA